MPAKSESEDFPYDSEKRVWVDHDGSCAIFFSSDGKKLSQTIGVPGDCGDDDKRSNRQTDIARVHDGHGTFKIIEV